jgi:hypothetical protein
LRPLLRLLAASGVHSLLERTLDEWRAELSPLSRWGNTPRSFVRFTLERLDDLLQGEGWQAEFPRDVWLLRRLDNVVASRVGPWVRLQDELLDQVQPAGDLAIGESSTGPTRGGVPGRLLQHRSALLQDHLAEGPAQSVLQPSTDAPVLPDGS